MKWTFKKVFYGAKTGQLDLKRIREFLEVGHTLVPYTYIDGYYRSVYWDGDYNKIYDKITTPWPDILTAQAPRRNFALHLSGGFDSSILAKLYDRPGVDYIHLRGPETAKVEALAKCLQGKVRFLEATPKDFIQVADAILPRYPEPESDAAGVLTYICSREAAKLGHDLILTGDCSDTILGGHTWGPHSEKAIDVWKTLDPNNLLGIETLMPFGHPGLKAWVRATLPPEQVGSDKLFLRKFAEEINLPPCIVMQKKTGWGGCWDYTYDEYVMRFMKEKIAASEFDWIGDICHYRRGYSLFRIYSMVKWLEANYPGKARRREDYAPSFFTKDETYPKTSQFVEIDAKDKLRKKLKALMSVIGNNRFAIYGAGKYGMSLIHFMNDEGMRLPGLILEDNSDRREVLGIPIKHVTDAIFGWNDFIILGTETFQAQMCARINDSACQARVIDLTQLTNL